MAAGPVSTKTLRKIAPDAGTLMLRNVYGWFERESRGIYRLTEVGMAALRMAFADGSNIAVPWQVGDGNGLGV